MALFVALTVVIIIGVAATAWWWVSTRLSNQESTVVYDTEEAADFIAASLPDEVNARLDRDRVIRILQLHLGFMRESGMATYGGVDEVAMHAAASGETVVAHEDEAVDWVSRQLSVIGDDTEMVDVVVVVDLSHRYLQRIGAFGPRVEL